MTDFIEELEWRGMIHQVMPGTKELLQKERVKGYIGFDPTADSLHIGSLAQIMILRHFQRAGHQPVALVGGATGMIGDPSGKSEERNLLSEEILARNLAGIRSQLASFLDFDNPDNPAEIVNNYDWYKEFNVLDFLREVGKHITVNYMMAKESVKKRLTSDSGISFTEFSYQLIQGYDFYWLYAHKNCKLQMGGSDQWGNIVTGTELIRRKTAGEAYAITTELITKADGSKFGKTEGGNVWLDPTKTSPYQFYQFWLNTADDDAGRYLRIFTFMSRTEIESLEAQHAEQAHLRLLQKRLAEEVTVLVHGRETLDNAIRTSQILFGEGTEEALRNLSEAELLDVFEGVPQFSMSRDELSEGIDIVTLLGEKTQVFTSKSEARKGLQANSVSINKQKMADKSLITSEFLLKERYILVQKGKKNYFLLKFE